MKLLNKDQYFEAILPLKEVSFNHLFASAVVEQKIEGMVFADSFSSPTCFYILHPYGMSLLIGNWANEEFIKQLTDYIFNIDKTRNRTEWMQVSPESWSTQLSKFLGNQLLTKKQKEEKDYSETLIVQVEEQTRVNFRFDINKYYEFRAKHTDRRFEIFRTGEEDFQEMPGTVVPKFFWRNASQFVNEGVGFSIRFKGELACTAFSVAINDHQLELGIESVPRFRGMGFAMHSCSALIEYCLKNSFEPIWACRYENTGSYLLAQKLGFRPVSFHPFYKMNY